MSTMDSPACDRMYSKLIDDEASHFDELNRRPDAGFSAHPVSPVRGAPRQGGPGPYRLATLGLATLCAVLLVSIIAVTAHYKNMPQGGGKQTVVDPEAQIQKQKQEANITTLTAALAELQQEKDQLKKEKDQEKDQLQKEKDQLQQEKDQEKDQLQKEKDQLLKEKDQLQKEKDQEKDQLQKEKDQLQKDKDQLQKEKDQLLAQLATTKAPEVIRPATTAAPPVVCPENWLFFNSSCYFISAQSKSWRASQTFCQSKGGHLAIIHTAEEQKFVWDLLPRGYWNAYWFGISDQHTEDHWKWVDGTPLVGGFWDDGEPNNHIDEDCGYIIKTLKLERVAVKSWYDAPCIMHCPFICEKEVGAAATAAPQ